MTTVLASAGEELERNAIVSDKVWPSERVGGQGCPNVTLSKGPYLASKMNNEQSRGNIHGAVRYSEHSYRLVKAP